MARDGENLAIPSGLTSTDLGPSSPGARRLGKLIVLIIWLINWRVSIKFLFLYHLFCKKQEALRLLESLRLDLANFVFKGSMEEEDVALSDDLHFEFFLRKTQILPEEGVVGDILDGGETVYAKVYFCLYLA